MRRADAKALPAQVERLAVDGPHKVGVRVGRPAQLGKARVLEERAARRGRADEHARAEGPPLVGAQPVRPRAVEHRLDGVRVARVRAGALERGGRDGGEQVRVVLVRVHAARAAGRADGDARPVLGRVVLASREPEVPPLGRARDRVAEAVARGRADERLPERPPRLAVHALGLGAAVLEAEPEEAVGVVRGGRGAPGLAALGAHGRAAVVGRGAAVDGEVVGADRARRRHPCRRYQRHRTQLAHRRDSAQQSSLGYRLYKLRRECRRQMASMPRSANDRHA